MIPQAERKRPPDTYDESLSDMAGFETIPEEGTRGGIGASSDYAQAYPPAKAQQAGHAKSSRHRACRFRSCRDSETLIYFLTGILNV